MSQPLQLVDPEAIPALSGRFEPVRSETEAKDLPVRGRLPGDLGRRLSAQRPQPKVHPTRQLHIPPGG